MKILEKIEKLQKLMIEKGIHFYIIPSSDYHQSEYVGDFFKCREWISGFTGSAGTVVVSRNEVALWTDGRYFLQAENELKGTDVKLFKMGEEGVPNFDKYISDKIKDSETLGFDGKVLSTKFVLDFLKCLKNKNINILSEFDLVSEIWNDRPELPASSLFLLDEKYTGEVFSSKLKRVREILEKERATMVIISSLDDIAWLFNMRGNDVKNNPVFLSYSIITKECVILYIDKNKITYDIANYLKSNNVQIKGYFDIYEDIKSIKNQEQILLDFSKTNYAIYHMLDKNCILNRENPTTLMKAIKNKVELENLRHSHLKDGVAVTKFMYWLKTNVGKIEIDEISASEKLENFRKEQMNYFEASFDTICGYEQNAAIIHYKANENSCSKLENKGLLLVDSGGQYLDGTTDITRTFVLGECSKEKKENFTLVLKGLIRLSKAKFLYGSTGTNLDILARESMWEKGINYNHGTGHGIGFFLNVHEGPQSIRMQYNSQILEEGMVLSNEPGIYIANSHGIRLENEIIVKKCEKTSFGQFMNFETLTYAPIDLDGVLFEMLTKEEIDWLEGYHKMIFEKLIPFLTTEEINWFKQFIKR